MGKVNGLKRPREALLRKITEWNVATGIRDQRQSKLFGPYGVKKKIDVSAPALMNRDTKASRRDRKLRRTRVERPPRHNTRSTSTHRRSFWDLRTASMTAWQRVPSRKEGRQSRPSRIAEMNSTAWS